MEYPDEYQDEGTDQYGYHNQFGAQDDYHSGDPRLDLEYERQYPESYRIPEAVRSFLVYLAKAIDDGYVFELQNMYESSYVKLTERFFKTSPWPPACDVAASITEDPQFLTLYKELYYRHLYARVQGGPSINDRIESYSNYCDLFNLILNANQPVSLELPNQWLWEIIDEFIYQFQSYSHYQALWCKRAPEEILVLRDHIKIFNVHSVLNVLHSLVEKSNINRQLEVYTNGGDPDSVAGEFGKHPLYKMLGYFSLVGLLRLHSLLGDYYQAIKVLENIELNKKSLYSRVPACQITTYYYVGFAYMMMRRYADAIRTFSNILLYIQRTQRNSYQQQQQRTYQMDQINKQTERMYTLLAICLVLHPQRIDESVLSQLKEKHGEKLNRMQRGDLTEFENSFSFACPKFVSPVPPDFKLSFMELDMKSQDPKAIEAQKKEISNSKEPFLAQLNVFMDEVTQQLKIPIIRSYLKLYTAMPIMKLSKFLEMDDHEFIGSLLCFKHKMKNLVWTKGTSGLEGEFQSGSEVDFYIDNDMIHIADTKVARRYGDFFIRQIHKFDELYRLVSALQL